MLDLKGKTAVVTGGGSGIGRAVATVFARQGAIVHIIELNLENGEHVVNDIKATGGIAYAHACDVSNQQQVSAVFDHIQTIDILVNNAGIAHVGRADTTTEEDFVKL